MSNITGLEPKGDRVRVFLDGRFAFSLQKDIAASEGLKTGQAIDAERAAKLDHTGRLEQCYNAATRYLSYRPQSEYELRTKLARRGCDQGIVQATIDKLKEQGLVDDASFAEFWQQNRRSFSPRSQRMTQMELKKKGVSNHVISGLASEDESESAYRAAESRVKRYINDEQGQRRLAEFLWRRGYGYDVVKQTIERIWKEHAGGHLQAGAPASKVI